MYENVWKKIVSLRAHSEDLRTHYSFTFLQNIFGRNLDWRGNGSRKDRKHQCVCLIEMHVIHILPECDRTVTTMCLGL